MDIHSGNMDYEREIVIDGGLCLPDIKEHEESSIHLFRFIQSNNAQIDRDGFPFDDLTLEMEDSIRNLPTNLILAYCHASGISPNALSLLKVRIQKMQAFVNNPKLKKTITN